MEKKDRLFLDMVKGFAIFIMIWSHVLLYCLPKNLNYFNLKVGQFIGSFNMPILMLVSGYLYFYSFNKRSLKELILHRSRPLLFTIIVYGIVHFYLTTGFLHLKEGNKSILFNGVWFNSLNGNFWFLWSVLTSSIVVAIICKKIDSLLLQILFLIVVSIFIYMCPCGELTLFVYPYYIIGFYFAKYKDRLCKFNKLKFLSLIYPIMLIFYSQKHFIYTTGLFGNLPIIESIKVDLFRWVIGLIGSVFILTIFEIIYNLITNRLVKKEKKPIISYSLAGLGKDSLKYYVVSVTTVSFYLPLIYEKITLKYPRIDKFFNNHLLVYSFVFALLLTLISCVFLYLIIKLIKKVRLNKILFGDK